ncbi:hypothetical protein [Salarchaeum sp. JOR-1]|uniref:DUF7344 domain-containing protein n=1 Tax=Salarchaeum sp. JOR-1 TaxID=2599399 RepID=UPI001198BCC1|nr:hypothetical protein [Salarchaeum sp. JOR-1]QDX39990.1 hypothetical protein FQU85_03420 [Salarchaeum sp. JOR-1]
MPQQLLTKLETTLTPDDVFRTMSNQRRRYAFDYLRDADSPVPLRDLSEHVAALENDVTPPELTRQQRKRVYTALHQTHLPMMDSLGVVEYDQHRTTVQLTAAAREVEVYVEVVPEHHFTWAEYYGLLAAFAAAVALAVQQGIAPDWLTNSLLVWLSALSFGVSALVHHLTSRTLRVPSQED